MYSKILVPLDGSEVAECVLPYVEAMAEGNKEVDITFLYVIQPLDVPFTKPRFRTRIESEARTAAGNYLKDLINRLEYGEAVHSEIVLGKVAENIVDYAIQNSVDLIIMATHGFSGVGRWVRGSVADKVLHESGTPVWLIRADACQEAVFNTDQQIAMLVPLDGSDLAGEVLDHVGELAQHFGLESTDIVLVRVCELFFPPYTYPPPTPLSWEEYLEYETKRCKEICQRYLSKIEGQLKKDGLSVRSEVLEGSPADAIVDYANKNAFNLIVMSTHGRTGLRRWAFGSIAEKVLNGASTPIFLVR